MLTFFIVCVHVTFFTPASTPSPDIILIFKFEAGSPKPVKAKMKMCAQTSSNTTDFRHG